MSTRTVLACQSLAAVLRGLLAGNADSSLLHDHLTAAEGHLQDEDQEIAQLRADLAVFQGAEADDQSLNEKFAAALAGFDARLQKLESNPIAEPGQLIEGEPLVGLVHQDDFDALALRVQALENEDPGDLGLNSGIAGGPAAAAAAAALSGTAGAPAGDAGQTVTQTAGGPVIENEDGSKTDATGAAIDPNTGAPATMQAGVADPIPGTIADPAASTGGDDGSKPDAAAAGLDEAPIPQEGDAPAAPATAVISTDPDHGATDDAPVIITQDDAGNVLTTPVLSPMPDGTVSVDGDGTPTVTVPEGGDEVVLGKTEDAPEGTPAPGDQEHVDNPLVTDVSAPVEVAEEV